VYSKFQILTALPDLGISSRTIGGTLYVQKIASSVNFDRLLSGIGDDTDSGVFKDRICADSSTELHCVRPFDLLPVVCLDRARDWVGSTHRTGMVPYSPSVTANAEARA